MIASIAYRIGIVVMVGVAAYGKGWWDGDGNGYDRAETKYKEQIRVANDKNEVLKEKAAEAEERAKDRDEEVERLRGKATYFITDADLKARGE